ncbi:MAG: hypothetical protein B7Z14_04335 [Bosea sp. 32-68-6]|nr:MAG: hypothetical protein B7Z14_04335 [Bosea sp. 32-68-6]
MVIVIQYLRGLAAALVVYTHLDTQIARLSPGAGLPWAEIGNWGVDIFFVISGFIMYVAAIDLDARPLNFLMRRAVRIVPLYWAITAVIVAAASVVPSMLASTSLEANHVLASLLFLPWPNPAYPGLWPVLIPGWTLNYEMYFYIAVAIGLLAPRRFRILLTSAIVIGVLVAVQVSQPTTAVAFYGNDIVLEFLFGLLAGYLFTHRRPLGAAMGACLIALSIGSVLWMAGSALPQSVFRPGLHLGDMSYSLYLTHVIALPMVTAVFSRLGARSGLDVTWAYPVVAALFALLVAAIVYRVVEKPLTRQFRGVTGELRARAAGA